MLTTKEISDFLKVSEETVRRWIRTGELDAEQEGKSYKVHEEVLKKFIEKKAKEPGTSLAKFSTLLGGVGGVIASPLLLKGLAAGFNAGAAQFAKKMKDNKDKNIFNSQQEQEITIQDIEYQIESLKRHKKKLELEHQMKLLEIDEDLARYQSLKEKYEE